MTQTNTLMYKGKPLVRQGQFLFYGFPDDKYILFMNIIESKKVNDLEVATRVMVQIQSTDDNASMSEKVVKECEKQNFFDAFDIGVIWLERELRK